MSTSTTTVQAAQGQTASSADGGAKLLFNDIGADTFLKLLIAELQNQDPLSPMENSEMVQQLNQIYQVQSNMKMVETFDAVTLSQNLASAAGLLGKTIQGLDDGAATVTGQVEGVTIVDGVPKLHVGGSVVSLKNVSVILAASAEE